MVSTLRNIHLYFAGLGVGKIILWCYLIWYVSTVAHHFDASPSIWLNSIGISVFIGFALMLSVGNNFSLSKNKWQTFRLFLMPFCVSSFSALIKGKGFILIFPTALHELVVSAALCIFFIFSVLGLRQTSGVAKA